MSSKLPVAKAIIPPESDQALPPVTPSPPDPQDQPEIEHASTKDVPSRMRWIEWLLMAPSWLVSTVVHATLLLILAMMTLAAPAVQNGSMIVSQFETETADALDELKIETPPILDPTDLLVSELVDPGPVDFGDMASPLEIEATAEVGSMVDSAAMEEVGLLFGNDGAGMSEIGEGMGAASFFGVATKGNRFVFVVDNSNSMSGGKFETACVELVRSVNRLDRYQQFFVVFFSDTAYPLFYPKSANRLVPATDENKRNLEYWLATVHRCLRTDAAESVHMALALNPDVIYLLTDGSFTDNTLPLMLGVQNTRATIHTLGFRMRPQAEVGLRQIAKKFKGKFTEVQVTQAMAAKSRQMNRPRNVSQNGVWGIKLGQGRRRLPGKRRGR